MRSLFIFLLAITALSCNYFGGEKIYGNKKQVSRDIEVGTFNSVTTSGDISVRVAKSPTHSVRVATDENLIEYLDIYTDGSKLVVKHKDGFNLVPSKDLVVYVSAPDYNSIEGSGSVDIRSENTITSSNELYISISGSGEMKMSVNAPKLVAGISGSGTLMLDGNVEYFVATVSGSGDIRAFDLVASNAEIELNGSADAAVTATKSLQVDISGSGSVQYKGNPTVRQNVSGSGSIEKVS